MHRFKWFVVLFLVSFSVLAQPGAKSYAPEDLRQLSNTDRVRVLNNEYSDLSGGQRLQEDQLEFYLDQIQQSNWSFTQIRDDMQKSLGARPDFPNQGNPNQGGSGYPSQNYPDDDFAIECTSRDNRYQECVTNLRNPRLVRQLSSSQCIEGQSWGVRGSVIWVNRGCRALFADGVSQGVVRTVQCSSRNQRQVNCLTNSRWLMRLQSQLSSTACTEGYSWGNQRGLVWVSRGCRGIFEEAVGILPGAGTGAAQMQCESSGGLRICPWDQTAGRPEMLREYSRGRCVQGRTWGVDRRGLWVNSGCSGLFGLR